MTLGFDVISDLNLSSKNKLDWEGKPTSLFCLIPGNISSDFSVIEDTLKQLSSMYHGVFFIDGPAEIGSLTAHTERTAQLAKISTKFKNVVYLHNNVVIVDGIAIVGINGWFGNHDPSDGVDQIRLTYHMNEDLVYLYKTIEKLQLHVDVKKIVIVSNSVPDIELFYNQIPFVPDDDGLVIALINDTEKKVETWVYGSSDKLVDATIGGVNYVNNGCFGKTPYWPKRIDVTV